MRPALRETDHFRKEVDRLARKYPHVDDDLQAFCQKFVEDPARPPATPIPGYQKKVWKIRVGSTDQQRGKSGGFRLIFYFDPGRPETVHLLTIYPKSEREDLSQSELWELYKRFLKIFNR